MNYILLCKNKKVDQAKPVMFSRELKDLIQG